MAAPKGNQYALGHGQGRPARYKDAEELTAKIIEYFDYILGEYKTEIKKTKKRFKNPETGKIETNEVEEEITVCIREPERAKVTTLARFLGFESRKSLNDYAKKEVFRYPIKRALLVIEEEYEEMLPHSKGSGVIFALKNLGWEDRSTVDSTIDLKGKPDWLGVAASKKVNNA